MAANLALGETVYVDFVISDANGAAANADSTPTFEVYEDATNTPIVTGSATSRGAGRAGLYYLLVDTNSGGFEVGKCYGVIVLATVGTIAAKARVESFKLRLCTIDAIGVQNVKMSLDTDGVELAAVQPNYAVAKAGDPMTLTSGERAAVATATMAGTGNDTVANSPGKRIADTIAALNQFAGLQLTGTVAAGTVTAGGFGVTLNPAMGTAETPLDLVGLWVTFRSGNRQAVPRQISTATVNSPTSVSLTFGAAFSAAPAVGDFVSISA